MDLQDHLVEHLRLDADLTAEQAAQILVGAAGYARDALRAGVIEAHLRALHRLATEVCVDWPIGNIPAVVQANLEMAAKCRSLIQQRRIDVEQEVMILRAPLPAYGLPC